MNQRGLTLVEVMVALGIFATVSVISVSAFSLAARGAEQLEEATRRTGDLERLRGLLRQDLYQAAPRAVFEPEAQAPRPPFMGGRAVNELLQRGEGEALLALVRTGWANPGAREPRPELQAVTYLIRDQQLIRRTRPFLDAVIETPFRDDVLLTDIAEAEIEFLVDLEWRDSFGLETGEVFPAAIKLSLEHPDYGPLEQVFLVGGPRV